MGLLTFFQEKIPKLCFCGPSEANFWDRAVAPMIKSKHLGKLKIVQRIRLQEKFWPAEISTAPPAQNRSGNF